VKLLSTCLHTRLLKTELDVFPFIRELHGNPVSGVRTTDKIFKTLAYNAAQHAIRFQIAHLTSPDKPVEVYVELFGIVYTCQIGTTFGTGEFDEVALLCGQ
jgi:hypothetical protein